RTISLEPDSTDAFDIYMHWIHRRSVSIAACDTSSNKWEVLLDAYLLGHKLEDADFRDAVTDALFDKFVASDNDKKYEIGAYIERVFKHT
ncbi:hypothetical protein K469DRAFT_566602, partial [Zopfia rhizophila CBS 207.26]